jgi:hypothetical protein
MARDAGHADADRVLAAMTAGQVCDLLALEELEPRGPIRDDRRFARLASAVVNNIPFRGKDAKALREADVFETLRTDPLAAAMAADEIRATVARFRGPGKG